MKSSRLQGSRGGIWTQIWSQLFNYCTTNWEWIHVACAQLNTRTSVETCWIQSEGHLVQRPISLSGPLDAPSSSSLLLPPLPSTFFRDLRPASRHPDCSRFNFPIWRICLLASLQPVAVEGQKLPRCSCKAFEFLIVVLTFIIWWLQHRVTTSDLLILESSS